MTQAKKLFLTSIPIKKTLNKMPKARYTRAFRVNFFGYLLMVEVKCIPFISHIKIIDNQISSVYKRKRIVEYMLYKTVLINNLL